MLEEQKINFDCLATVIELDFLRRKIFISYIVEVFLPT